jgi:translation elongation factor P/translation initiation factor 5A
MAVPANDMRRGMAIDYNGDICVVLDTQHRTPGNLRAFIQASLRSVRTGKSMDVRFSSAEKVEVIPLNSVKMEFSYKDGEDFVFSDPETYETVQLAAELVGDAKNYLIENASVTGQTFELQFTAQAGQAYAVEFLDERTTSWATLTNVPAPPVATNITVADSISGSQRFYRLRLP